MRTKILSFGAFLVFGVGFSQNTFPTGAGTNVGIGTTSPSTRLQITSATAGTSGVRLTNLTSSTTSAASNGKSLSVDATGNIVLNTSNVESSLFAINSGIAATSYADYFKKAQVFGAGSPTAFTGFDVPITRYGFNIFDLYKSTGYTDTDRVLVNVVDRAGKEKIYFDTTKAEGSSLGYTSIGTRDGSGNEIFKLTDEDSGNVFMHLPKANSRIVIGNWGNYLPAHKFVVSNGSAMIEGNILTNSNIGIGTSSFTDGADTYRLSVNGAVRAQRVKVYTTWADYVFEKNYNLPTLPEVEQYIKENGHLKDIPSAADVEKNGIDLGDINKLLLQKVEELTLYVIDLKKELNEVKSQIKRD